MMIALTNRDTMKILTKHLKSDWYISIQEMLAVKILVKGVNSMNFSQIEPHSTIAENSILKPYLIPL